MYRSTKGASKQRRDLINAEISKLRDLLPLPASTRARLSQLQLMALVCVYVRKIRYFSHHHPVNQFEEYTDALEFVKALNGFLVMITKSGKLLYITENVAEYLGHSMVDLMTQGDSFYDLVDRPDHEEVKSCLENCDALHQDIEFSCQMNVTRSIRKQAKLADQKVFTVRGHYMMPVLGEQPIFVGLCQPVILPENKYPIISSCSTIFTTVHTVDMRLLNTDKMGEQWLGYSSNDMRGISWYQLIHPEDVQAVAAKHKQIISRDDEKGMTCLARIQTKYGLCWNHMCLQLKKSSMMIPNLEPVIIVTNQLLSNEEASVLNQQSWIYTALPDESQLLPSYPDLACFWQDFNVPSETSSFEEPCFVSESNFTVKHRDLSTVCNAVMADTALETSQSKYEMKSEGQLSMGEVGSNEECQVMSEIRKWLQLPSPLPPPLPLQSTQPQESNLNYVAKLTTDIIDVAENNKNLLSALESIDSTQLDRVIHDLIPEEDMSRKRKFGETDSTSPTKYAKVEADKVLAIKPDTEDAPWTKSAIEEKYRKPWDDKNKDMAFNLLALTPDSPHDILFVENMPSKQPAFGFEPLTPDSIDAGYESAIDESLYDSNPEITKPLCVTTKYENIEVPNILTPDASPVHNPYSFNFSPMSGASGRKVSPANKSNELDSYFEDLDSIIQNDTNEHHIKVEWLKDVGIELKLGALLEQNLAIERQREQFPVAKTRYCDSANKDILEELLSPVSLTESEASSRATAESSPSYSADRICSDEDVSMSDKNNFVASPHSSIILPAHNQEDYDSLSLSDGTTINTLLSPISIVHRHDLSQYSHIFEDTSSYEEITSNTNFSYNEDFQSAMCHLPSSSKGSTVNRMSTELSSYYEETNLHLTIDSSRYITDEAMDVLDELEEFLRDDHTTSPGNRDQDELYQLTK